MAGSNKTRGLQKPVEQAPKAQSAPKGLQCSIPGCQLLLSSLLAAALLTAWLSPNLKRGDPKQPVLRILIWSDYINPAVVGQFEKQEHCTVHLETYTSNEELMEMLLAGRFPDADIIVPSSYQLATLKEHGYLQSLDRTEIPNSQFLDSRFVKELQLHQLSDIAVPYFVAPTGLAFHAGGLEATSLLGTNEAGIRTLSWRVFDQRHPGGSNWASRFTLLNDKREAIGAALLAAGLSPTAADPESLRQAEEVLTSWCKAGLRFDGKAYQYHLLNGRTLAAQAYMGDIIPLGLGVEFALPKEGFVITCDCLAILKSSKQKQLAHRFVNFLCEPKVSAENMRWTLYRAPNETAFARITNDLKHPILEFLGGSWARDGKILPPLSEEQEERIDGIWKRLENYRDR